MALPDGKRGLKAAPSCVIGHAPTRGGGTIQQLLDGYRRFRGDYLPRFRRRFAQLAQEGQSPPAMVISCCDSRVDPAWIFDAGPGELFVLRNVANLVPPYAPDGDYHGTSAAIEFAVRSLQVRSIVVMGHGGCGGVRALLDDQPAGGEFISAWMDIAAPARAAAQAQGGEAGGLQRACEHEVVRTSLRNLRSFPWVAAAEAEGRLALHGAWFDVAEGTLLWLPEPEGEFQPVL